MSDILSALRSKIASTPWRSILPEAEPSIDHALQRVANEKLHREPRFDPYEIEALLRDVSKSLDKCLTYRREAQDIDAQAITHALDYQLFEEQRNVLTDLEVEAPMLERYRAEHAAHQSAAKEFSNAKQTNDLAAGFFELSENSATAVQALQGWQVSRRTLIEEKWRLLAQNRADVLALHEMEGSSLHYKGRYKRILKYLVEDFGLAYEKAISASLGLKAVHGIDSPALPTPATLPPGSSILDEMVYWAREILTQLDLRKFAETEFEVIISLNQVNAFNNLPPTSTPLGEALKKDGEIAVDLTTYFEDFPVERLRCMAVGLSLNPKHGWTPASWGPLIRSTAVVFPPAIENLFSAAGGEIRRAPILFSNVHMSQPTMQPTLQTSRSIQNVDPRGEWRIHVGKSIWFPDSSVTIVRGRLEHISDIKLHLQLCGVPDRNSGSWGELKW